MSPRLRRGKFLGRTLRLLRVERLTMAEVEYPVSTDVAVHSHESAYLSLILRGSYRERYVRRVRHCHPLTLAFHPAGEPHTQSFDCDVVAFNIDIPQSWIRDQFGVASLFDRALEDQAGQHSAAGFALWSRFASADADPAALENLAAEIIGRFGLRDNAPRESWVADVCVMLAARTHERLQLRDVAREIGLHPVYVAARFRSATGYSIGEYARRCRIEHVLMRLKEPHSHLASIAIAAGFSDQSHLTRTFKRFCGMTPAEYRRTLSCVQDGSRSSN